MRSSEHGFENSAQTFTTFVYAAGVHLIIATTRDSKEQYPELYLFASILVLFLFSDWASRTRLPRLLPDHVAGYIYVAKTLFEIVGVFFLICSFQAWIPMWTHGSQHSPSSPSTPEVAFGMYLIITAFWDYLMLYVMQSLPFRELADKVFGGTAIDLRNAREHYLGRFDGWLNQRRQEVVLERDRSNSEIAAMPDGPAKIDAISRNSKREGRMTNHLRWFEAVSTSLTQGLANHVLYANLLAGTILLLRTWDPFATLIAPLLAGFRSASDLNLVIAAALPLIALALFSGIRQVRGALARWIIVGSLGLAGFASLLTPSQRELTVLLGFLSLIWLIATGLYEGRHARRDDPVGTDEERSARDRLAGGLIGISFAAAYLTVPGWLLVVLIAAQQVLANVFLQLAVDRPSAHHSVNASAVVQ